jgi:tetratricopeptide (TPR) repeat protein
LLFSFVIKNPIRDLILRDTYTLPLSGSSSLETGGTESGSIRKIVWTGALRIWLGNVKNFMIGTGPETFAQSYYQYRPREHNDTSEWELLYNKAHNEFLNQLATTGLLGFTAYLVLLITMLVNFKFQISNLQIALFAGWLTILVTNFWGFSVVITQLFLYLFPALAIIHNTQEVVLRKQKIQLNYWQLFSITGAIFAICYLLFAIGSYWHADIKYASGSGAHKGFQMSNDPQYLVSAFQNYFRAYQLNPNEPVLISEFGLASAYLATALRADATSSSQLASQSLALSQKAINISPRHPNYYKNFTRGLILLSEIDPKYLNTAIDIMQMVSQISPTDPRIPYYMGVIRTSQGATTEAKLYFQKALDLKPDFADAQRQLNTTQVTGVSTESSSVKNSLQGNGD